MASSSLRQLRTPLGPPHHHSPTLRATAAINEKILWSAAAQRHKQQRAQSA